MMFVQRFVNVFYPMHRKRAFLRVIDDSKALILGTGIVSAATQVRVSIPYAFSILTIYLNIFQIKCRKIKWVKGNLKRQ